MKARWFTILLIAICLYPSDLIFTQDLELKFSKEPIPGVPLEKGNVAPLPEDLISRKDSNTTILKGQTNQAGEKLDLLEKKSDSEIKSPYPGSSSPAPFDFEGNKKNVDKLEKINTNVETGTGTIPNSEVIDIPKEQSSILNQVEGPLDEYEHSEGVFSLRMPVNGGGNTDEPITADFLLTTGTIDQVVNDLSYYWYQLWTLNTIPAGAYVTNVEYRVRITHTGDPNTFYCSDYEVWLSSEINGSPNKYLRVYDNLGGRTDGGYDDDVEDDSDIYLNWRSTIAFNGEDPAQKWCMWVEDNIGGDYGLINYIEFRIYWEASVLPNLIANYTPSGWSAPIVASSVPGTNTDGPNLNGSTITYIDFAFVNRDVDIPTSTRFYTYLYRDGSYLQGWYWDGMPQNYYGSVEDYEHTFLISGYATLETNVDATGVVNESNEGDNNYSRDVGPFTEGLPNLIANYTPSGWDAPIVASSVPGTNTDGPNLNGSAITYIDFAFVNRDVDIPTSTRFYTYLYRDGSYLQGWYWDGMPQNYYGSVEDYEHTFLISGYATLETNVDATGVVNESNEGDNNYSRQVGPFTEDNVFPDIRVEPTSLIINESTNIPNKNPDDGQFSLYNSGEYSLGLIVPDSIKEYWQTHIPQISFNPEDILGSIDWSNNDSPVKNQGSCGSCWAFAAVALIENLGIQSDLSEQEIVSCSGAGDCVSGYYGGALDYVQNNGITPESCFPYSATNGNCADKCVDPVFLEKITSHTELWGLPADINNLKGALQNEPLIVYMKIYSDFYNYPGGIYTHTSGTYQGAHAVLLVGYNDDQQCFTFKNSWGPNWGENGYCRISYADVTGDVAFGSYAHNASGVYTEGNDNFTIFNDGGATLTITAISDNKDWLQHTGYPTPFPFDIAPGESQVVSVSVEWNLISVQDIGIIEIDSNDPDEPTVQVDVTAVPIVTDPALCVSPDSWNAPSVGGTSSSFSVTNCGNSDVLTFSATPNDSWLGVSISDNSTPGYFQVTAEQNCSGSVRTGSVTISSSGINSINFSVTQPDDNCPGISVWLPDITASCNSEIIIPVTVEDLTGKGIISFEFTVEFDPLVLVTAIGINTNGDINFSGWTLLPNTGTPGEISVAGFGASALSGSGTLLYLVFHTSDVDGATSPLNFTSFIFNAGSPLATTTNGSVTLQCCICGDADENGVVQAYDAALVLRYVLSLPPPPPLPTAPEECFDPDGNGNIQAYDAALILFHVLGLDVPDPNCWGEYTANKSQNNLLKIGLQIEAADVHQNVNETEIVLGLSGFDTKEGVSAIQMDVKLPDKQSNIVLSELPEEYLSGINKIEGNTYRIGIVNPYGIDLKDVKLVLTSKSEESINILEFSNVYLNSLAHNNITTMLQGITLPVEYGIGTYPNPFNPSTKIKYRLPEKAIVEIKVFDILGREVVTLINSEVEAGTGEVEWSGKNNYGSQVSSGIYIVTMKTGSFFRAIKINLLK